MTNWSLRSLHSRGQPLAVCKEGWWNSYSRSGSPFLPGALLGEDRDIYRRKLSRSGADRGFPVHGFVGAVVKAKAAKQISKMFGNKFVVLILYLTFFLWSSECLLALIFSPLLSFRLSWNIFLSMNLRRRFSWPSDWLDFAGNPNIEISKWIFVFKKTAAPMVRKHQKTTARFYCAFCLFHFARARPTRQMVNLCMSPDSDLSALPTFPNVPNVQWYYR